MALHGKIAVFAGLIGTVAFGSGCGETQSRVTDLGYYAGGRPAPIAKLPPAPTRRWTPPPARAPQQTPTRPAPGTGLVARAGWTPPGGFVSRWDSIVIHHSASDTSTPEGMREWHMNGRGWDELGYHFVIGNGVRYEDGKVFVGNRWTRQMHGAHCKTPNNHYNDHGIGICLIGDFQNSQPSPKQIQSLAQLTQFLMGQCGIKKDRILTHGGVTHKTECPGRNFNIASLMRSLDGAQYTANHR